ncbi:Cwf15/Cwc15 cell cycle control protein [Metarhizium brunneum]
MTIILTDPKPMRRDASGEAKRDLIWNPPTGHDGGNEFKAIHPENDVYISSMKVWTHKTGLGDEVIKAIELIWSTGQSRLYGHPKGDGHTTTFQKSERITKIRICSGDWVDSIYYESTKAPSWRIGGSGGIPHDQDTENGVFVGFWGRSGDDIDKLGSVFEAPRKKTQEMQ